MEMIKPIPAMKTMANNVLALGILRQLNVRYISHPLHVLLF
jgi:hypothetical protein